MAQNIDYSFFVVYFFDYDAYGSWIFLRLPLMKKNWKSDRSIEKRTVVKNVHNMQMWCPRGILYYSILKTMKSKYPLVFESKWVQQDGTLVLRPTSRNSLSRCHRMLQNTHTTELILMLKIVFWYIWWHKIKRNVAGIRTHYLSVC